MARYWQKNDARGIRPDWLGRVRLILSRLEEAEKPQQLNISGLNFHLLTGNQAGRFSVLVSRNWRITFGWDGQDVTEVDLEDYHGT